MLKLYLSYTLSNISITQFCWFLNKEIFSKFKDSKIQHIKLDENKWNLILLVGNILNSFYKYALFVLRTINIDIYLEFRIFDAIFNYLEYLKKIIKVNIHLLIDIKIKTCNKVSTKLAKYYSRIKELEKILYNFVNMLDFTQKLNLYKL